MEYHAFCLLYLNDILNYLAYIKTDIYHRAI